jgi:hypothetical protein
VKRIVLFGALAVSLLVPAAAAGLFASASTESADRTHASSFEKLELYEMFKEAARLDAQSTDATPGTVLEFRRIARETLAWANRFDADPEWEEFARATSAYASLVAKGLSNPGSVTREEYEQAVDRVDAANARLPERLPLG